MSKQRIDVHTHLIPPFWAEELRSHGGDPSGWGAPDWSPEQLLKFVDDEEIAVSVLSLTAPGIEEGAARMDIARRVEARKIKLPLARARSRAPQEGLVCLPGAKRRKLL